MKLILDTDLKKTICPKAFFDNIRQINELSNLTGRNEDLEWKEYLNNIVQECTKDIINEKDVKRVTRNRNTVKKVVVEGETVNVKEKRK